MTKNSDDKRRNTIFPLTVIDDNGIVKPNRFHEELKERIFRDESDFIIPGLKTGSISTKPDDILRRLNEAHQSHSDFMAWAEMMLMKWKRTHPGNYFRIKLKGISFLKFQQKLLNYTGIDLIGFFWMYLCGIESWPEDASGIMPVAVKDKYYLLVLLDGFRNKQGITKYRLMKLLLLQPSDISYLEVAYTERAQRRKDITVYKLFQILYAMHIPLSLFISYLYRLCRDNESDDIEEHYSSLIIKPGAKAKAPYRAFII